MKRYILLLSLFIAPSVFAVDISISASVNRNVVALDEQLELNLSISGGIANLPDAQLPQLAGFTSYSAGRSQNISFVNGSISSSVNFRYVLAPKSAGKFTIPPIVLEHDGKRYQTQPIDIEVVSQGKAPAAGSAQQAAPLKDGGAKTTGQKDLFITASVDRHTVHVNEQLAFTFRFYRAVRLTSNPQYAPPNFSGFWTEELPPKTYNTTVNGRQYSVTEISTLLFPARPGKFTLDSASLQCRVEDFNQDDFFNDEFFSSFFSGGKVHTMRTNPLSIDVTPLPDSGKPAHFSGAVGQYSISASLDKTVAKVGDPVTLTLTVSGKGNIKTLENPALPEWTDFRKYETVTSLNISKEGGSLSGSKTFKTVIVPQTPGRKDITGISLSFYDPALNKYRQLSASPLSLEVKPGPIAPAQSGSIPYKGNDIKIVSRDIRHIKPLGRWVTGGGYLYSKKWFIVLNIFPILAITAAYFYSRRVNKLSRDVAYARRSIASKTAKKYLKKAKAELSSDNFIDFYCAGSRAILEYIAHKVNVSADGLTSAAISELLSKRNINPSDIAEIKQILEECDFARFAPSKVTAEMKNNTYTRMENIISRLDKTL